MSALMKQIIFNHLGELLREKSHIRGLIKICKSHPVWNLRPPVLVFYVEDLEKHIREIKGGIYDIQLDFEVNSIKRQ